MNTNAVTYYHLPGLFELTGLYRASMPLYHTHRYWFTTGAQTAPSTARLRTASGAGRIGAEGCDPQAALALTRAYGISARLTFSNSLLRDEHLADRR